MSERPTRRGTAPHRRVIDLVRDVPCGIYTVTREGRALRANPALTRLLGLTAGEGLPATMAVFYQDPADQDLVWAMATGTGPAEPREVAWRTRDGRPLTVRLTARAVAGGRTAKAQIDVYVEDVTDARRLEAELRQAQKMEGIGRLASEVAHDFNNLLTTILGYADLVLAQIDPAKPIYGDLREIQSAGQRAAVLTQQLLAYSRQQARAFEVMDLQEVVATADHRCAACWAIAWSSASRTRSAPSESAPTADSSNRS